VQHVLLDQEKLSEADTGLLLIVYCTVQLYKYNLLRFLPNKPVTPGTRFIYSTTTQLNSTRHRVVFLRYGRPLRRSTAVAGFVGGSEIIRTRQRSVGDCWQLKDANFFNI